MITTTKCNVLFFTLESRGLTSYCTFPINCNGPGGLLAISIKRNERTLGLYYSSFQDLMFAMLTQCDLGFLWPTCTQELQRIKLKGSGEDRFSLTVSRCLSFTHLSLTVSPPTHREGKTQPVVHHSLDRGPLWPPSSNFRLHVCCAREPAPANSRSSQFLLFYFEEWKPTCSQAPCHGRDSWTIALYFCNHFASVCSSLLSICHFLCTVLIEYLSVNFTRCTCFPTELMMPKDLSVI